MDPDDTSEALVPAILRPARPRRAEAHAAVAGLAQGRGAWEALEARGVIAPALHHDAAHGSRVSPGWMFSPLDAQCTTTRVCSDGSAVAACGAHATSTRSRTVPTRPASNA